MFSLLFRGAPLAEAAILERDPFVPPPTGGEDANLGQNVHGWATVIRRTDACQSRWSPQPQRSRIRTGGGQRAAASTWRKSLVNLTHDRHALESLAKPPQSGEPLHGFAQRYQLSPAGRLSKGSLDRPRDIQPLAAQRLRVDLAQK